MNDQGASTRARRQPAQPAECATLVEALDSAAEHPRGSATGLRFLDRRERVRFVSWREVHARARRVARGLLAQGVENGDLVGIVYPTEIGFFDAFFGVLLAGAVPAPLYPPVRLGRLDEYHRSTASMLAAVEARLVLAAPRVKRLLGQSVLAARPALGCRTAEESMATGERTADNSGVGFPSAGRSPQATDLALVQFSSGTTAAPRPVALEHRAVLHQARMLGDFVPERTGQVQAGMSWLPLYHDMGLIGGVFTALGRPADLTLLPPELFLARPAMWLRAISRSRATVSPAPNFAYSLATERIRDHELEGVDLSNWRLALNGAESVSPRIARGFVERFSRWGFRAEAMTPVYGLAEAALAVTFSSPDEPLKSRRFDRDRLSRDGRADEARHANGAIELASVGRAVSGFEVEIRCAGELAPAGTVGRIHVRGPSLMRGYVGQHSATADVLVDGWLDTGDEGFLSEGELYVTGRAKDVLLLRGRNHAPEVVEAAIDGVWGTRRGCVVAVSASRPDREATETLYVFVEHARGVSPDEGHLRELEASCRDRVRAATGLTVDELVVVSPGTLPRTSSGKLKRRETLDRYRRGALLPPAPTGALHLAGAMWRSRGALRQLAARTDSSDPGQPGDRGDKET